MVLIVKIHSFCLPDFLTFIRDDTPSHKKQPSFYRLISLIIFSRIIFRAGIITATMASTTFNTMIPAKTMFGTVEVTCKNCTTSYSF